MTDFSYLDAMAVDQDDLAELTLFSILLPNGKHPTLIGRHGGESNAPYANAVLKKSMKRQKMLKAGIMTVGTLKDNRDEDRALYPQHVLTGWRDVCDAKGVDAAYSKDAMAGFIAHLPDDIFDEVREFFGNAQNFRQTVDTEEAVEKGKT